MNTRGFSTIKVLEQVAMYRVVVFIVFVVTVSAQKEKKCVRLLHPSSMRCCSKIPMDTSMDQEAVKECMDLPFKPHSCEREECIAKKKGYYVSGGGMNFEAITAMLEKELEKSPQFLAKLKETCFKDVSKYGPPDMCDLMKMRHCIQSQMLMNCDEWSNEGECNGIKELVEECTKDL